MSDFEHRTAQPSDTDGEIYLNEDVSELATRIGLTSKSGQLEKAALLIQTQDNAEDIPGITSTELEALERETTHPWRQPKLLYFNIFVCSLGAIEQGWAQTGINGANLYLLEALGLTYEENPNTDFYLGLINCSMYVSNALLGCWLSEPMNNIFGRRGAIFGGTLLCIGGNLGSALVPSSFTSIPLLVAFRLILGVGLGLNASTVSVFAAESAPAYIRGGLAVSWQMFVAFGILLGFAANLAVYNLGHDLTWRLQLAAPVIPALPLLLLIYFCPESPSWHVKHSRYGDAFSSLCRLRHTELQAAVELYSMVRSESKTASYRGALAYVKKVSSLFTRSRNLHALVASYTVMLSQQMCGINILAFYSTAIFSGVGGSMLMALWASVVFGLINFLGAFPAIWSMDSFGRRKLLLFTLPAMSVTMAFIAMVIGFPESYSRFVSMACLIYLFCALYSPGMGPVPCAYSAEVYPLYVREIGMSVAISTANAWAAVLSLTLPPLLGAIGTPAVFGLYASLNFIAWILCWLFVRETKGVRLEEMDAVFASSFMDFTKQKWHEAVRSWQGGMRWWRDGSKHAEGYGEVQQDDPDEV